MRRVFSSARIENAEAVARMLREEGIEVRIENGRSFRKGIQGNFSYRHPGNVADNPSVWVIRSDDQPRARELLRDMGLLDDASSASRSYLPRTARGDDAALAKRRTRRMRLMLIAGAAIVVAAVVFKPRPDQPWQPTPRAPAQQATQAPLDPGLDGIITATETVHLIATPPALAVEVARLEGAATKAGRVCLAIEGADPAEATLAAARDRGTDVVAASTCDPAADLRVDVYAWRTDGSGSGEVTWSVGRGDAQAKTRTAQAERVGDAWQLADPR